MPPAIDRTLGEYLAKNGNTLEKKVYTVPEPIDREIARLKLAATGVRIDRLTPEQVRQNAATYAEQAYKILDRKKTQIRFNSEWLTPFMKDLLLDTLKRHTVQQVTARGVAVQFASLCPGRNDGLF